VISARKRSSAKRDGCTKRCAEQTRTTLEHHASPWPVSNSPPPSRASAGPGRRGRGSPARASPRSRVRGCATRRWVAMRHDEVERRGLDDFAQTHASRAGPRIHRPRHAGRASSESASKPPVRLAKPRMSKVSPFASVKPPVRSMARPPSSVVSLLTVSARTLQRGRRQSPGRARQRRSA
jgi:hypothetical protein